MKSTGNLLVNNTFPFNISHVIFASQGFLSILFMAIERNENPWLANVCIVSWYRSNGTRPLHSTLVTPLHLVQMRSEIGRDLTDLIFAPLNFINIYSNAKGSWLFLAKGLYFHVHDHPDILHQLCNTSGNN